VIKDNSYLYGEGVVVPLIPKETVDERIAILRAHLDELLEVDWRVRDGVRCNAIIKAIKFWENLNDK
jgi:hypothetical protein